MSDHIPDLDLVTIVILALLLGVFQGPGVRAKLYRVSQEQVSPAIRIPHISRLVCTVPEPR
jgi:hypothetical protein